MRGTFAHGIREKGRRELLSQFLFFLQKPSNSLLLYGEEYLQVGRIPPRYIRKLEA